MKNLMVTDIGVVFFIVFISFISSGCSKHEVYDFNSKKITQNPLPGLEIIVNLKEITHHTDYDLNNYFLHFDYSINNTTADRVIFNFGKVRLKLSGCESLETWNDSHIDYLAVWDTLLIGQKREYHLYTTFPDTVNIEGVPTIELSSTGLK